VRHDVVMNQDRRGVDPFPAKDTDFRGTVRPIWLSPLAKLTGVDATRLLDAPLTAFSELSSKRSARLPGREGMLGVQPADVDGPLAVFLGMEVT
jgi:hypothetical protein